MTKGEAIRELEDKIADDLRHHLAKAETPDEVAIIRRGLACIREMEMDHIKQRYDGAMIKISL